MSSDACTTEDILNAVFTMLLYILNLLRASEEYPPKNCKGESCSRESEEEAEEAHNVQAARLERSGAVFLM